jgi:hypothetical protein
MTHEAWMLSAKGDEQVASWDPDDVRSVDAARATFDEMIAKGFKAYEAVDKPGREVKEFDPSLGKILFAPAKAPAMGGGPLAEVAAIH